MRTAIFSWAILLCLGGLEAMRSRADEPTAPPDQAALHQLWSRKLTGTAWIGRFTILGADDDQHKLHDERYEILRVEKLPHGDLWLFQARIKYAEHDVTLPVPLAIKWAGSTPVITLDHVTLPGLGTFDARVVIDDDKYAGTWQHDDVGGHLFGRIEKLSPTADQEDPDAPRDDE
jgi:hypothetical protein